MRLDDWHQSRTKEQIDHLFEVYATERQDDMNALVVAFAIATAGLTYVIAAVAYLAENCKDVDCAGVPEWIRFSAPAVTVVLVGFLCPTVTQSHSSILTRVLCIGPTISCRSLASASYLR